MEVNNSVLSDGDLCNQDGVQEYFSRRFGARACVYLLVHLK